MEAVKRLENEVSQAVKYAQAEVDRRLLDLLFGGEYEDLRPKLDQAKVMHHPQVVFLKHIMHSVILCSNE